MSDITREFIFEKEICAEMAKGGWLHSRNDSGYNRAHAVYVPDLMAWLEISSPSQLAALKSAYGPDAEAKLLERLSKAIEDNTKGILGVLNELKIAVGGTQVFQLYQRRPVSGLNPDAARLYAAQRFRVMQQVRYSVHNEKCIDLVLFVNGLPLATLELKSSFKQSVKDAIEQYQHDRDPGTPKTGTCEPLLSFGMRALVHFAVDGDWVYTTTKLEKEKTRFLPFNLGRDDGAGNPPNPAGYPVSYLWERVLTRDGFANLLDNFIKRIKIRSSDAEGRLVESDVIIFPRYHQWEAANLLLEAAKREGVGQKYLVQHSAGSGKSNTIAWLAHGLASARNAEDKAVFDGVIIVTDRRILDTQLGSTVEGFANQAGEVLRVADEDAAKSRTLAEALSGAKRIVIVTLQTFPFVLGKLKEAALSGRKYAVIADEAHSSQSGSAASKLKQALGLAAKGGEDDDGEEESLDEMLADASASRGAPSNVSFFAFTATPKAKTLQIFGRLPDPTKLPSESNKPMAFHVYTMKQAIEEGFIIDVLRNFTPYETLYRIGLDSERAEEREVDRRKGGAKIRRWVDLHPTNIAQKCKVIVEHFRSTVRPMLEGQAKAMIVTSGRLDAVRFKRIMDNFLRESGIADVGTIVAFSGEVEDPDVPGTKFTESNMNDALQGMDIVQALKRPQFNLLIVANKYQTGFDEPMLCGMYVDKQLSGVATVQTLSRLNRVRPGKNRTYIVDFRNTPEGIVRDFEPYYRRTELSGVSDPNLIYTLQEKLGAAHIFTDAELDQCAEACLRGGKGAQAAIISALRPGADRFRDAMAAAVESDDSDSKARLEKFRQHMADYLSAYEFLAQICSYNDATLEKLYLYLKALSGLLREDAPAEQVDITGITLLAHELRKGRTEELAPKANRPVKPLLDLGTGGERTPERERLEEIIRRINALFEGELSEDQKRGFTMGVVENLAQDDDVLAQARTNDRDSFADGSFKEKVRGAIAVQVDAHKDMGRQVLSREKLAQFVKLLAELTHEKLRERAIENLSDEPDLE